MAKLFSVSTNTAPTITINLVRDGVAIDLTGCTVNLYMNLNGTVVNSGHTSCSISSPTTAGIITYAPQAGDFTGVGLYTCEVKITYANATNEIVYQTFQISVRDNLE